jgi:hypothetical protein
MNFDLTNLNPGTWFDFEEGGARVCLRVCDGDAMRQIRKKTIKKKAELKKVDNVMQKVVSEETNEDLQSDLIWDYCIVDWEGFFNVKTDEPILCTTENKLLLMGKSVEFSRFVADALGKLRDTFEGDEAEKNF